MSTAGMRDQISEALRAAAHWCEGEGCSCRDDAPIRATEGRPGDITMIEGSPEDLADAVATAHATAHASAAVAVAIRPDYEGRQEVYKRMTDGELSWLVAFVMISDPALFDKAVGQMRRQWAKQEQAQQERAANHTGA